MTPKLYRAVIEHQGASTLEVIAKGTRAHCVGAIAGWRSITAPSGGVTPGTPLIVVEMAA